ncbi:hypothetical protein [Candidatus Phytoplasma meliae]|uniref:Sequence-variable mosaic (SVM) signal sequence domain-containing protein n=1 Tax=Candidatus Phytoplasma meliae TaxID=1848402 RepID=A0ABS5CY41_9MOLU|nr:hypothetical protein [Candidatus Phytoplasma meliae]MBP5835898.1 hypothetical protein [Candidatus Phytoplasma meliae]
MKSIKFKSIKLIFFLVLIFFIANTTKIFALEPHQTLKRCNAFKYNDCFMEENNNFIKLQQENKRLQETLLREENNLIKKQIKQVQLNATQKQNINPPQRRAKIYAFFHQLFHCGLDILSLTNEIIDFKNN